jgi:hypothetical protein
MTLRDFLKKLESEGRLEEGTVRDFLNDIAKGNYKYFVGKSRNGNPVIKDIDTGEFASFETLKAFLGKE